jgi:hypothetical protein
MMRNMKFRQEKRLVQRSGRQRTRVFLPPGPVVPIHSAVVGSSLEYYTKVDSSHYENNVHICKESLENNQN